MMKNYQLYNKKRKPKIGRWILAALAIPYFTLVTINSVNLSKSLKPLEDKFKEFINQEDYTKKRVFDEEYDDLVTTLNYKEGSIDSLLKERDAYLKFNKGTRDVRWDIKQYKVGEPKYLRTSGNSVVWNPFADVKS